MRTVMLGAALVWLAACASSRNVPGYDPLAVRMCVENTTVGYGNVVGYVGNVRFTVYSGEEVCKEVHLSGAGLPVRMATTGGGGTGPLRWGFTLPGDSRCWHWRVTSSRSLDIVSCDDGLGY